MADKTVFIKEVVPANTTVIKGSNIVAAGKRWVISSFGGLDINIGDDRSSIYLMQWGSGGSYEGIRAISVTGSTYQIDFKKEFVGDGAKQLRVVMKNTSDVDKELAFWFDASERG